MLERITSLRIKGLWSIKDLEIAIGSMNVLIGENGSGKSAILKAAELLRAAAKGGFPNPDDGRLKKVIRGDSELYLEAQTTSLRYGFSLACKDGIPRVVSEELCEKANDSWQVVMKREPTTDLHCLLLPLLDSDASKRMVEVLDAIVINPVYRAETLSSGCVLEMVQLGLGRNVDLSRLSDGQKAFVSFAIMAERLPPQSLLVYYEPEAHLHDSILPRVVCILEEVSERVPVLVSTYSNPFLDALRDPADSVLLCSLDDEGTTVVQRPNKAYLDDWCTSFNGIGSIQAAGYLRHVFDH